MNSNHFPDLSRCKKLTEIGFPETEMWWYTHWRSEITLIITSSEIRELCIEVDNYDMNNNLPDSIDYYLWDYKYRCPSVMEMLDVIPDVIENREEYGDKESYFNFDKKSGWYEFWYLDCYVPQISFQDTLPNALADLIFWLVENSYLTIWKSE